MSRADSETATDKTIFLAHLVTNIAQRLHVIHQIIARRHHRLCATIHNFVISSDIDILSQSVTNLEIRDSPCVPLVQYRLASE
jgi:hypothetical protein